MVKFKFYQTFLLGMACATFCAPSSQAVNSVPSPAVPDGKDGKRVIVIEPVTNVSIQMPDESFHDFGSDFQERMRSRLTDSNHFIVVDPDIHTVPAAHPQHVTDPVWSGTVVPAATIRVKVKALSFSTGSRGERMFYGFDERVTTPFNDGSTTFPEEFPLRTLAFEPNWFDRTFDEQGYGPFGSRSGLDLSDGFDIHVFIASLGVKYAFYQARLDLELDIDAPIAGKHEIRNVQVQGSGYFFDLTGMYENYSAGIMVARKDAMERAFSNVIDGSYNVLEQALTGLPLTATIDSVLQRAEIGTPLTLLLGTGIDAQVKIGVRYELVDDPQTVVEVQQSVIDGSIAKFIQGDVSRIVPGKVLRETGYSPLLFKTQSLAGIPQHDSVILPATNFSKASFLPGQIPSVYDWGKILPDLLDTSTLAYRLVRYFEYDQVFREKDAVLKVGAGLMNKTRKEPWAHQIGLDQVLESSKNTQSIVAVIDSGVDYNHAAIHDHVWTNPSPVTDPEGRIDLHGWDFVSGDERPFDDGYHGTELASAILAVAPGAEIMPLKIFNPWGITKSAFVYAAFQYAVDHGAQIILCGWATERSSRALEMGIDYARAHGVLVVAAAGDLGQDLTKTPAYPAALSDRFDNLLVVAGVDTADVLDKEAGANSNFGSSIVQIAAPGREILVAEPRGRSKRQTKTGISAALVAGAAARLGAGDYVILKNKILDSADLIPGLKRSVQGGRRLKISSPSS